MLFLDEKQLLRCRGRINNFSLPQTSKNPILLPSSHHYVDLLIRHTHELVKHSAMTNTLTTLRERFWILKGRQAVKGVLKRCVRCRKLEGLPYSSYNSPDLPSFRVSDDPPFTHTGLDPIHPPRWKSRQGKCQMLCMFIHLRVYESCSPRVITKSDSGVVSTSLPTICQPSRITGYIDIRQRKNI